MIDLFRELFSCIHLKTPFYRQTFELFMTSLKVAYISEVWCQENNLTLNVNKRKEMIVDFRKQQREQPHIHIDWTVVEKVESFKFLGVHITDKLK